MKPNRVLRLAFVLSLAAPFACAQDVPAPPPAPALPAPPAPGEGHSRNRNLVIERSIERSSDRGTARGGPGDGELGIVPPGTWWKNPDTITKLSLSADQQKRMDDIFRQNRLALIDVKASLEKEQINLEPLLNANPVDSTKALAEISKIADLRAGLEKANAKMLLGLRSVLTADQWTKLQADQHNHRGGPMGFYRGNPTQFKMIVPKGGMQTGPGAGPMSSLGPVIAFDEGFSWDGAELEDLSNLEPLSPATNMPLSFTIDVPDLSAPSFTLAIPRQASPAIK